MRGWEFTVVDSTLRVLYANGRVYAYIRDHVAVLYAEDRQRVAVHACSRKNDRPVQSNVCVHWVLLRGLRGKCCYKEIVQNYMLHMYSMIMT